MSKRQLTEQRLVFIDEEILVSSIQCDSPTNGTYLILSNDIVESRNVIAGLLDNELKAIYKNDQGNIVTVDLNKGINYRKDNVHIIYFDTHVKVLTEKYKGKVSDVLLIVNGDKPARSYLSKDSNDELEKLLEGTPSKVTTKYETEFKWYNLKNDYDDLIDNLDDIEDIESIFIEYKKSKKKENVLPIIDEIVKTFNKNVVLKDENLKDCTKVKSSALLKLSAKTIRKNKKAVGKLFKKLNKSFKHVNVAIECHMYDEE